tara:strand:+ start:727 stop:978 length:252 start_codon:yes stop_codon:yes gene_type:complete
MKNKFFLPYYSGVVLVVTLGILLTYLDNRNRLKYPNGDLRLEISVSNKEWSKEEADQKILEKNKHFYIHSPECKACGIEGDNY